MSAERDLLKLSKWKATNRRPVDHLGVECVDYFKHQIEKRQKKFGKIGEAWLLMVPPKLQEGCDLVALTRGTLTIIVEGSSQMYLLKQAMLAGLQDQLLHACRSEGLRKIALKPGKIAR